MTTQTISTLNIRDSTNIRDLATITPIPPATIVRGEMPAFLTTESMQDLYTYGIRTVIDLRSDNEIINHGNGPAQPYYDNGTILHLHADFTPTTDFFNDPQQYAHLDIAYRNTLEQGIPNFIPAINDALTRHGGIYIHCAVGKDRTGMIIAALASLLGATRANIINDYMITLQNMPTLIAKTRQLNSNHIYLPENLTRLNPQTYAIDGMLNLIETNGSTEQWWHQHELDIPLLHAKTQQ